jgi:uncharacterized protein YlzI (FlbEa/FlbD family)
MYIKLTRLDGSPIWLNAAFIVTVEPQRKSGGSLVVPVGDGLDYEVRESPETVLAMLDGAPVPEILPIPSSDALTATPPDVSPDESEPDPQAAEETPKAPKKTAAKRGRAKTATTDQEDGQSDETKKKKPAKSRAKKKIALKLDEAELERLRKLAPKTVKKLGNTISTQFKVDDVEKTVEALAANGIIELMDGERVVWVNAT